MDNEHALKIVLDFVERHNKQDAEIEVADAAARLQEITTVELMEHEHKWEAQLNGERWELEMCECFAARVKCMNCGNWENPENAGGDDETALCAKCK
jgi:hypothetical protein